MELTMFSCFFWAMKKSLDNENGFGAIVMDLSKALDCVNNELLTAKLHAYGLDLKWSKLIHIYLNINKQKVITKNSWSAVLKLEHGFPEALIVGLLFLNIHICDLFRFINAWEIVNDADDTTSYTAEVAITDVISSLEACSKMLFKRFDYNCMQANSDKCHLL